MVTLNGPQPTLPPDHAALDNQSRAWLDAVGAYGIRDKGRGKAARKLDHALSALIMLSPDERHGFLIHARQAVDDLAKRHSQR